MRTPAEVRADIAEQDGLASATGLAPLLKVSRARVNQLAEISGFPEPVPVAGGGRVWLVAEVVAWRRARGVTR